MTSSPPKRSKRWDDALEVPGTERLLTLTDGVVAIALTLLVLQLQIPSLPAGTPASSSSALGKALTDPAFTSLIVAYLISFYVIAQFWLAHHRVFRLVSGHSEVLAWWNFGFLLTITLFPFSSELLGRYSDNKVAVIEFSINLLLASLATTLTLAIARSQGLLIDRADRSVTLASTARGAFSILVIGLSIVVAFWSPENAKFIWILLAFAPVANRLVDRYAPAEDADGPATGPAHSTDPGFTDDGIDGSDDGDDEVRRRPND